VGIGEELQGKIEGALTDGVSSVVKSREEHYRQNPDKLPVAGSVDSLISSTANLNAAISGGASLIPGPWGMAAVIPELIAVINRQLTLIYDIGAAHGKQKQITKELVLGIMITGLGTSAGSLLTIHGSKVLVRRASLRAMQKIIALLGGKISQQVLKRMVSKWVPVAGAAAMAVWTRHMTVQIGRRADEIFRLEIQDDPSTMDIELDAN
jgi:uncharacterized protein (DUF697 family)